MQNTVFFNSSKKITNDFLQSIVFLDDEAYCKRKPIDVGQGNKCIDADQNNKFHDFDAQTISKIFAKEKKLCAVYKPEKPSDIVDFIEISKKADVVILDWYINLSEHDSINSDPEADANNDDPRGEYTKQIITELISNSGENGLKLIIVYTGEDILDQITQEIYDHILLNTSFQIDKDNCEVSSANIRILVRAKSSGDDKETRFTHRPNLKAKILTYNELPDFVLTELTKMTEGLLSNFALLSLTQIRNNSHKILSLFSKELDPAYLGHKVLLPNPSDSKQLLLRLFGETISELLEYAELDTTNWVQNWIESNINSNDIKFGEHKIKIDAASILKLLQSNETNSQEKLKIIIPSTFGKTKSEKCVKLIEKNSTKLFESDDTKLTNSNFTFAKLTHHKSLLTPRVIVPELTLGSVIKSCDGGCCYICIQQKCDSVRLESDENRRFLFLPLENATGEVFNIIGADNSKYILNKKSYHLRTIKFKSDSGKIKGCLDNDKYIFCSSYNDKYEWLFDLKDLHSQRIVAEYSSNLSRVGLDESEWLRIAGTKR